MSVKVAQITKIFGEQKALNNVSFAVSTGEIVGLLGPNGAGKSTLMKIITGYIKQNEGTVEINGLNTLTSRIDYRKTIGYLPENNPIYYDMFVKEYLHWVANMYGLKNNAKRVQALIEQTGINNEQYKKIGALSKGFKQRVGLAQAIMNDPEVLILDEPTTGLDPNQIVEIRSLISEIAKDKTIILSTHIMQEVEAICDRIVILNHGNVVADGKTSDIMAKAKKTAQSVVCEFVEPIDIKALLKVKHVTEAMPIEGNKFLVLSDSKDDIRPLLFNFAKKNDFTIITLQQQSLKLEDIFQDLTL